MHLLSFSLLALVAGSVLVTQQIGKKHPETPGTFLPTSSVTASADDAKGLYRFHQPDRIYTLPPILQEISGIALADATTMYCIQDEQGVVYKYDLRKGEVIDDILFGEPGDYEDLTIVNGDIHILRSDTKVFRVNPKNSSTNKSYQIPVACTNVEGLSYSVSDDVMYVACKNPIANKEANTRSVYQFSPRDVDNIFTSIVISQEDVFKFLPGESKKSKKPKMAFNPSGIAAHPLTGDLYVLSATQRYVGIFSKGVLQNLFPLPAEIYYQPEGIVFSDNGDLYISSEGSKDGKHKAGIYFLRQQ